MINYKVCLNNGIEAFGVSQKTVTANEDVKLNKPSALRAEIRQILTNRTNKN